jgi:UDP-GlcNAc:undecaprenyl-phosphate/decaprenyl-phosphate GlcNAc-1-phosphate transferase
MNYLLHFVTPFGTSLIITILLIPVWITICRKWKLFDEPDGRKHHAMMTPSMGGIAIFAGIYISFLIFAEIHEYDKIRYLFGASLILFFTGFFDDLMDVPPLKKLLFQAVCAVIVNYGGYSIVNLDGLFGFHEVYHWLQMPLTVLLIVMFTNAFNFIDGVDGLAATLGIILSSAIGALFFYYGKHEFALLSFCITGSLLGFLFFNFNPARIFMGDTGSLVVGFMLATLSIELLNTGIKLPAVAVNPSLLFAILFIPLFDISRVLCIRIANGASLYTADRNHIHHLIMSHGFGHKSTALLMSFYSVSFIFLQQLFSSMPATTYVIGAVILAMLLINTKVIGAMAKVHHKLFGNGQHKNVPFRTNS